MSLRCRLGLHDFHWPKHTFVDGLWTDEYIACWRGCGARTVRRCRPEDHWKEHHSERFTEYQP